MSRGVLNHVWKKCGLLLLDAAAPVVQVEEEEQNNEVIVLEDPAELAIRDALPIAP